MILVFNALHVAQRGQRHGKVGVHVLDPLQIAVFLLHTQCCHTIRALVLVTLRRGEKLVIRTPRNDQSDRERVALSIAGRGEREKNIGLDLSNVKTGRLGLPLELLPGPGRKV